MRNGRLNVLKFGIVAFSISCILALVMQNNATKTASERAIRGLGKVYMSVISEQLASHFGTVTEMNLKQAVALVDSATPGSLDSESQLRIKLSNTARSLGFDYAAFFTSDNKLDIIYGPEVKFDVPDVVEGALNSHKYNVSTGKDTERNEELILISVPVVYQLENEVSTLGLVVGTSAVTIKEILDKNLHTDILEYYIIRDDGHIILESQNVIGSNYFERVKILYDETDPDGAQVYLNELKLALRQDLEYANIVTIGNERQYIYCTNLPNSYWHLIVKIPNKLLDYTLTQLTDDYRYASIAVGAIIFVPLVVIFAFYFAMTKKQIHDLDKAKREAERLSRVKSDFLSNMSHDIKTPMNGIIGMTELALENTDNPTKVRAYLKKVSVSSSHLLNILNDILDMAKIGSRELDLKIELTSLKDVMQNVNAILWSQVHDKKLNFRMLVDNVVYENVYADSTRLNQIILNVAGNAVKFTPEGGEVTVTLKEEDSPLGNGYTRIILVTQDNGIGISKEFLPKIFDAFAREDSNRTTEASGAGMGLTITKYIVDTLGGTIVVESEPGVGSKFTITLDIEKNNCDNQELSLDKCDVLLVEADEHVGLFDSKTLKSVGLEVDLVTTLTESYETLEKNKYKYKLILLGWDSTGDVDTQAVPDLRDKLEKLGINLPIIVVSNRDWDELEFDSSTDIADGFIVKPLFRSSVYCNLRSFINAQNNEEEITPNEKEFSIEGMHVLIAEDNEINAEIAAELLEVCGCTVEVAENGKICYDKFVESSLNAYDVILMDIRMPVMNGHEATQAIRQLDRDDAKRIPIIAVSADAFEDDKQRSYNHGLDAHLPKPMDVNQVIETLKEIYEKRKADGT